MSWIQPGQIIYFFVFIYIQILWTNNVFFFPSKLNVGNAYKNEANADVTLREKIAVLAAQIKKERDRNSGLVAKLNNSKKLTDSLRVRLRNAQRRSWIKDDAQWANKENTKYGSAF